MTCDVFGGMLNFTQSNLDGMNDGKNRNWELL